MEKILADEVRLQRDGAGQVERVERLPLKERGSYRLGSATDPEATYRIHGKKVCLGYNAALAATPQGVIREIQAATGAEPDQDCPAPLIAAQVLEATTATPPSGWNSEGSGEPAISTTLTTPGT